MRLKRLYLLIVACLAIGWVQAQTLTTYDAANNATTYDSAQILALKRGEGTGGGGAITTFGDLNSANVRKIVLSGPFTYAHLARIRASLSVGTPTSNNNSVNHFLIEADLSGLTIKDPENANWKSSDTNMGDMGYDTGGFVALFDKSIHLTKLTLPSTPIATEVSLLQMCANCYSLTEVVNLDMLTGVNDFTNAFYNCYSLPTITLPAGSSATTTNFTSAFQNCLMLTEVNNLDKFTQISRCYAIFQNCQRLEKVTFNATQTYTGGLNFQSAFETCYSLKKIENLDKFQNCTTLYATFRQCIVLPEINLPAPQAGTIVPLDLTFEECYDLVFINNLEQYTLLRNGTTYMTKTFRHCRSLTSIRIGAVDLPRIQPSATSSGALFRGLNPNCLIYLPTGSTSATYFNDWIAYSNGNVIVGTTAYGDIKLQDTFIPIENSLYIYLEALDGLTTNSWNIIISYKYTEVGNGGTFTTGGSLRPCYYHCPVAFTLQSGKTATYTRNFTGQTATAATSTTPMLGWQGFTLPFNATATGRAYLDPCDPGESQYAVAAYKQSDASGGLRFELLSRTNPQISANTPYIIAVMDSGDNDVTFTIAGNTIPATPSTAAVYDYFDGNPTANPMKTNDLFNRWGFYGTFLPVKKTNFYQVNNPSSDNYDKGTKTIANNPSYGANAAEVSLMSGSNPTHWAPFRAYFQAETGAPAAVTSLQLDYIAGVWDFNEWIGNGAYDNNPTTGKENYWSQPNNWTCGRLPYDYESVTYRTGAVDLHVDHEIPAGTYGTGTPAGYARVMNVTGIENKNLRVLAGASLELTDNLPNLGATVINRPIDLPNSGIVYVNSEDRTNSRANGTLVIPTGAVQTATVYFDSKATNTTVGTNIATEERKWQYFGSPVAESAVRSTVFPTSRAWVRKYATTYEYTDGSGTYFIYWNELAAGDKLKAGEGHEISVINGQDSEFAFTGTLVTTDQTLSFQYRDADRYKGQWVMSNPFTSGIKLADITFTNIESNIYLFNTGSSVEWKTGGAGGEGNAAGQYQVLPTYTAGEGKVIPSMQGFVVKMNTTTEGATGSIKLPYPSTRENAMMRSSKPEEKPLTYTEIGLFSSEDEYLLDEMSIYTMENCTRSYEDGYDGRKVVSSNDLAWIYSYEALPEGNEFLQVNAVDDMNETLIAFKAQKELTDYLLEFKHHNTEEVYDRIILVDRLDETETDVTEDGSIYRFTATNETNVQARFLIRTSQEVTVIDKTENDTSSKVQLYQSPDKTWVVVNGEDSAVNLVCYNLSGQAVYQTLIASGATIYLPQERFASGVYIVKVNNTSRKIIL